MAKTSNLIIARNMKPDRQYINVLSLSDSAMLAAVNANAAATATNYSFIREERNTIKVSLSYSTCITCNYMAFQNPDYSNKWFFAWIDSVEYVGENTVRIRFTVDIWSTWHNAMNWQPVFVEREHVSDDTFGIHTLPEPVKTDLMISQHVNNRYWTSFSIIVFFTNSQISSADLGYDIDHRYCSPCQVKRYSCNQTGIGQIQADLADGGSLANANIISMNVMPTALIPANQQDQNNIAETASTEYDVSMVLPISLDGYVPVNKKCFLHPYNFISVNNGNLEKIYKYEKFTNINTSQAVFTITGGILPNGAATLYPKDYDGRTGANVAESLSIGDFPMIIYPIDSYAAWLAQKSGGTVVQGIMSTLTGALAGGLKGGAVGAAIGAGVGLLGGVTNYIAQEESARSEKDHVTGTNNINIDMIKNLMGYSFCQKSAVADDAERIDRFFSQFGYNVSTVKIPNYTGRTYWNYVKINGSAGYGALPESARDEINNILNKGTTIWHNHTDMGNYFAGGVKMQNPII